MSDIWYVLELKIELFSNKLDSKGKEKKGKKRHVINKEMRFQLNNR